MKWEKRLVWIVFLLLWIYIILRANFVFFVHDEMVTMWSYMIEWNPLPYQGYHDANNHFLNSFLGGLFMRMFNSDALIVVRLGNVLAFPIYFWTVYALRHYFSSKWAFYGLFVTLLLSPFLIEYFGLARGYGLSLAFLILALLQLMRYFETQKNAALIITLVAWLLAVTSNLTFLPFAILSVFYVLLFQLVKKKFKWMVFPVLLLIPLGYFLKYTFFLKEIGKLYYGESSDFIGTTLHSLTYYMWHVKNTYLDGMIILLFGFILFSTIIKLFRSRNIFQSSSIFSIYLIAAVSAVFVQNWLLEVNFPEDRTGLYLVVFFFGGLFFSFDYWKVSWLSIPVIAVTVLFLFGNTNLTHSIFWRYEHFDKELVTQIPNEVMGFPPSTSGRWMMEHELSRRLGLPMRIFQNADLESDTLTDYVLSNLERRPDLDKYYHVFYHDSLSNQSLFERNVFLPRKKREEKASVFDGDEEFAGVVTAELKNHVFVVVEGTVNGLDRKHDAVLVFSSEDSLKHDYYAYQSISLVQNCQLQNGQVHFKVTYALRKDENANKLGVYIWNNRRIRLKGALKLEILDILP